jgi:hypothetical protein
MLTVLPMSVLLIGVFGLAMVLASVARIVVLERGLRGPAALVDRGPQERPRVAA